MVAAAVPSLGHMGWGIQHKLLLRTAPNLMYVIKTQVITR